MQGRRIFEDAEGWMPRGEPGDYIFSKRSGTWYCTTPNGANGALGNHEVVEHEDGTITVSPSILVHPHWTVNEDGERYQHPGWHGYLRQGRWEEC